MQEVLQTGTQDKMHNADISTITLCFARDKHSIETHPYTPITTSTPIPLCTLTVLLLDKHYFFRVKHWPVINAKNVWGHTSPPFIYNSMTQYVNLKVSIYFNNKGCYWNSKKMNHTTLSNHSAPSSRSSHEVIGIFFIIWISYVLVHGLLQLCLQD